MSIWPVKPLRSKFGVCEEKVERISSSTVCSISIRFPELLQTLVEISETCQSATSFMLSSVFGQSIKASQLARQTYEPRRVVEAQSSL